MRSSSNPAAASLPSTTAIHAPVEHMDAGTVIKASQAISEEIVLEKLVEALMKIVLEHASAERGMLLLLQDNQLLIEAKAVAGPNAVEVIVGKSAVTLRELPETLLHTVVRTRESVVLNDAQQPNPFLENNYVEQQRPRSLLCLPLIKQSQLIGLLYLENKSAAGVFTPQRISVLKLLASQAAISLENARLYEELLCENRERQRADEALRASEASLALSQQISHTGSWRWNVATGEVSWSAELLRILGVEPREGRLSLSMFIEKVHPVDRRGFAHALARAVNESSAFQHDYRIVLSNGLIKHLHAVGLPAISESGVVEFVGTAMDITQRKQDEEALRNAQSELTRVARLTTMGEFAASIAHEINQPIAAILTNSSATLNWLTKDIPDLERARQALARIQSDGKRAADVIRGLQALARKSGPNLENLDLDEAIREVLVLTHCELQRYGVLLETNLLSGDRTVLGDRVQVQQVLLNLIMNGIEAMSARTACPKVLRITSKPVDSRAIQVTVEDSGDGINPADIDRIFDPFFTTKANGMGLGLSICRSIVEAHGGRLSVSPRLRRGSIFQFELPI